MNGSYSTWGRRDRRSTRAINRAAAAVLIWSCTALAINPPNGIAPVQVPSGGFGIDGDLIANTPIRNVGDWMPGANGTGSSVLNTNGAPLNPATTFHFIDQYNSTSDNTFAGGLKWTDDPNTWTWTTGKASSKTDINNVLLHVSQDANGHTWIIIAADRFSTSGDSYIDFEFLQNTLMTNAIGFTSAGPNGGRTVNDLLLSLDFISGGSTPNFYAWRWLTNTATGGFAYVDSTASTPSNGVFAAVNTNTVAVPFSAFGLTTYGANAFVEAAVDLTALLGGFDQCLSIGFKTIMVKTKTSASSTATISDFINPIQCTLKVGPGAYAGAAQTQCYGGATTDFALQGQATAGLQPIASTIWSVVAGTATIDNTNSLTTTAHVSSSSATLRLTVVQSNACTETSDIVLTVAPLPTCSLAGPSAVCPRSSNQFLGPPALNGYAWSITGNGAITGPTNTQAVTVAAGPCGADFTLTLTVTSNGCSSACSTDVIVTNSIAPTITAPPDLVLECPANTATNATGVATVQDNCANVALTYSDAVTNTCGGGKIIARTWTATDLCGNSASAVQNIIVQDTTPPTVTAPPSRTLECPADISTNNTGVATVHDGCSAVAVTYSDSVSNSCGGAKVITRIWVATDACGNSASALQTITVRDTTAPTITAPPSVVLECPADTSTNSTGVATAQDTCSSVTITYSDVVSNSCGGGHVLYRTWTATDACGNHASALQTITVRDTTAPTITAPPSLVLECPANTTTNATGVATAQDTCSSVTVTYSDVVSNTCGNTRIISRTWLATDACGNRASALQTITVQDTTPPSITAPPDLVLQCPANTTTNATGVATAQDGCSAVTVRYSDIVSNTCGGAKIISRTWTATDGCGNSASAIQTITVQDTTPPTITAPASLVLECPANTTTNATGTATAQDGCSAVSIAYSDSVSNTCGGAKVISRTWTATDGCGNSVSALQTITVRDTTRPTIIAPTNLVLECPADTSTNATGVATAQDGCSAVMVTYSDSVSNTCGGAHVIFRTWLATDACGNSTSAVQTITVRDTTPPSITAPPSLVLECPANTSTNATGVATAQDGCSAVTVTYSDVVSNTCGGSKIISRTWLATDACGNRASALQTISVRDTTPPLVIPPPDVVLTCPANTTTNANGVATAQDGCSAVTITYSDSVSNICSGAKIISRTWIATDACGNSSSAIQTITVQDTTPPSLTIPPSLVLQCPATTTTNATGVATASDACTAAIISYSDVVSNLCGGTKVILRTWTAADGCGVSTSAVQRITVQDTTPPTITAPTNLVLECPADTSTNHTGVATAQDGCSAVTITYSDSVSNSCGGAKVISRLWTATDGCGNSASALQTITVRDTTPPTITAPPSLVLECPANTTTNATGVATAQDGCSAVTVIYSDSVSNSCGGTKVITRTWTATDACGNSASALQTITVRDTTPPSITAPPSLVLECPANTTTNATGVATAQDGCSAVTVTYSDSVTNNCGGTKVIARTWLATDACGNRASAVQTITVRDTTPPTVTAPPSLVLECPAVTTTNATGVATAVDGCSAVTSITYSDIVSNTCGGAKVITRTWAATDSCGNIGTAVQIITVRDTTPPTITAPPSLVLECPAVTTTNATGVATAQDGCSSVTVTYSDVVSNICGGAKLISRTWIATDACGNRATALQTITVRDTTPPTITAPPSLVLQCPASTSTNSTGMAIAQDGCSSVTVTYSDAVTNTCGGTKFIARTWTATDACGNSVSALQTITVINTNPPSLALPPNLVLQCPGNTSTNATGVPVSMASCGSVTLTYSDIVSNGCGMTRTIWRSWTSTDQCGNSTNGTQMITVVDTNKPNITVPNLAVQCPGDVPPPYPDLTSFLAAGGTASDGCSPTLTFSQTSDSGLVGKCPGKVTRVYRVTDVCGIFAEVTQTITVQDTIPPVIACPTNATVECGVALIPANTGTATATDNCSTNVTLNYADAPPTPSCYNIGFYAADPGSNGALTYLRLGPASLPCPASAQLIGRAPDPLRNAVAYGPTASQFDAVTSLAGETMCLGQIVPFEFVINVCGGVGPERGTIDISASWATYTTSNNRFGYDTNYMVYCAFVDTADAGYFDPANSAHVVSYTSTLLNQGTINEQILGTFTLGGLQPGARVIMEVWLVLDSSMPAHTGGTVAAQLVSAQADSVPSVPISTTGSKTISVGNLSKVVPLPQPPPQQPPPIPPTQQPPAPPGAIVNMFNRTWTATDDCGNSSTCVQQITVRDSTPPVLTLPPDIVLQCPAADTSTNSTGTATAQDACGAFYLTYSDSVTNGCGGAEVISRLWIATDQSGNTTNAVQTITVQSAAPTVTAPADLVLECPANTSPNASGVATAQSTCSTVTNIGYSDVITNTCGGARIIARTWTAADACGNTGTALQTITIRDTIPPSISAPPDLVLQCPANTSTNATGVAAAYDGCSTVTVTYSDVVSNTCGGSKIIARTWTATDACGNSATALQTITVRDTTPPTITAPPSLVLECPANISTNVTGVATVQDGCSAVIVSYGDSVSNSCGGTKVITRTWIASNGCGYSASALQTITIRDTTPPTITAPPDLVLECPADTRTNATGVATAQDGCSSVSLSYSDVVSNTCGGAKVISRTWLATDACGNSTNALQTITVRDTTPPSLIIPPDQVLQVPADTSTNNTGVATAQDGCGSVIVSYSDVVSNISAELTVISRTWTATDQCGNSTNGVQTITVNNPAPPVITPALVQTISADGYAVGGGPPQGFAASYGSTYSFACPNGLMIGIYSPSNGPAAPNGLFWEPTATGLTALQEALSLGGPSGALTQDATDPTNTFGGGELARQTIALTLNTSLNTAGSLGVGPNNFGSLLYTNGADALTGLTVGQILNKANRALAGVGLPAGYDFTSLAGLLNNLNLAFTNRAASTWAAAHLSAPMLVFQCAAQVPSPDPAQVTVSNACTGPVTLTNQPDAITAWVNPNQFTLTRTWIAQDACGHTNSCSYLIQVHDTTPPTLVVTSNLMFDAGQSWSFVEPVVSDNCGAATLQVLSTVTNQPGPNSLAITRTWEAADASTNTSTCQQTVTITNIQPVVAPAIASQPKCQTVSCGNNTTLTVTATGSGPFTYQWRLNGINIGGATGSALPLNLLQSTNAGLYTVVIANAGGSVTSSVAVVDVAPVISMRLNAGKLTLTWPAPFILQSASSPTGPYSDVQGATSPYVQNISAAPQKYFRLRLPPFGLTPARQPGGGFAVSTPGLPGYNVVIQASTNLFNWVNISTNPSPCVFVDPNASQYPRRFYRVVLAQTMTAPAQLTPPSISTQPVSQTDGYGGLATLNVSANGSGPFTYQWRLNGTNIAGATTSSLSLSNLNLTSAGLYSVTVTGPAGSITSSPAVLNVAPILSSKLNGHNLTLTWPGPFILQSANTPSGPYTDVTGATSPYVFNITLGPQKFFRLRSPSFTLTTALLPGGQLSVNTPGVPGYNLVIQASTNLSHWVNIATNASPSSFVDPAAAQYSRRFYRAALAH
jgi:hypothetical protein